MEARDEKNLVKIEQELWDSAALAFEEVVARPVVVPNEDCDCLACQVARIYLLPFLPVTWH